MIIMSARIEVRLIDSNNRVAHVGDIIRVIVKVNYGHSTRCVDVRIIEICETAITVVGEDGIPYHIKLDSIESFRIIGRV